MNIKITCACFIFLLGGFFVGNEVGKSAAVATKKTASHIDHWKVVNDYNEYIRNSENYEETGNADNMRTKKLTKDPTPSLNFLVSRGEIDHVSITLPLVPNSQDVNVFWMTFTHLHKDKFLHVLGNTQYAGNASYVVQGEQPLHLQLWFRKEAKADVQTLIDELEKNFSMNEMCK